MTHTRLNSQDFRKSLSQFATGVTIITTQGQDAEPIGVTVNSFSSLSMDPPLILWSLAKSSYSLNAFQKSEAFNVHILAQEQKQLSSTFAKPCTNKFDNINYSMDDKGLPLLTDCAAYIQCEVMHQYEGGDHIIFVGRVVKHENLDKRPLIFHDGNYLANNECLG